MSVPIFFGMLNRNGIVKKCTLEFVEQMSLMKKSQRTKQLQRSKHSVQEVEHVSYEGL
jgi:hypothetical protein